jgi:hypothetical protein
MRGASRLGCCCGLQEHARAAGLACRPCTMHERWCRCPRAYNVTMEMTGLIQAATASDENVQWLCLWLASCRVLFSKISRHELMAAYLKVIHVTKDTCTGASARSCNMLARRLRRRMDISPIPCHGKDRRSSHFARSGESRKGI